MTTLKGIETKWLAAFISCLLMMVQGDIAAVDFGHWVKAAKTATSASVIFVGLVYLPRVKDWAESRAGSIEYGTFTATENIDFVSLNTREHFVPSGCSLTKYVSNNNGSTWETYNEGSDDIHTFSSTGTQLRVKYVATGNAAKAPYKMSSGYDGVLYGSLHTSVKNPSIPMKVSRARLRGKK